MVKAVLNYFKSNAKNAGSQIKVLLVPFVLPCFFTNKIQAEDPSPRAGRNPLRQHARF
jgi:hypothetical protein